MSVIAEAEAARLEDERRAVARAQAGEVRALEPVLAAHAEALYGSVILPRVGDRALAEDILKDTFVTAIERIDGFRWQGKSIFFWLRMIAMNKVVDAHRARGRSQRLVDALLHEVDATAHVESTDEALIADEDRRRARTRIEAAMLTLPERYARAVKLRLVEEKSREECAAALGVSVGNFDVILFRAVRAFRKAYGERDG